MNQSMAADHQPLSGVQPSVGLEMSLIRLMPAARFFAAFQQSEVAYWRIPGVVPVAVSEISRVAACYRAQLIVQDELPRIPERQH